VDGAEPGDALEVTVLEVETADWGWTAIIPGFGLLSDRFPDPHLLISRVGGGRIALAPGLELPARPFPGTLGIAPAESGRHPTIPPRRVGGNLDTADLVAGARIWLPVAVPGALLSAGDGHAAQGRGEVCGTAVETPARLAVRVDLRPRAGIVQPRLVLPGGARRADAGASRVSLGVHTDLRQAARDAVSDLVDWLGAEHGMAPELAYCLCSVAADLAVEELVNEPSWVVSATLPRSVVD
jgi:acetamidase/formamidase